MPISKYNPDGTVDIYNSKTGEVKRSVSPEQLTSISPKLGAEYHSTISDQEATMQLGQQGNLSQAQLDEIEKSKPQLGVKLNQKGVKSVAKEVELTEGERTKNKLAKTGLKSIGNVMAIYEKDPGILKKQLIPGKFASRSFDSALFSTVDTLLRIRTGATAPEEEIRRYVNAYGPQFGDNPEDVKFKLDNLENALRSEGNISDEEYGKLRKKKKGTPQAIQTTQQQQGTRTPLQSQGFLNSPIATALGGIGKAEVGIGKRAIDLLFPRTKSALTQGPQRIAQQAAARPNAQGDIIQSIINAAGATKDLATTAIPAGVESGLAATPFGKLGLLKGGAVAGGAYGASTPENISLGERIQKTGTGAAGGLLTGGLLKTPGLAKGLVVGKASQAADKIRKVFKVSTGKLDEFRKNTGLNFADEVIRRDLPKIKGKNNEQILQYYTDKVDDFNDAADKFLASKNVPINKSEVINIIDKQITKLGGVDRLGQSPAIQALQTKRDEILTKPDALNGVILNQFKRDLQTSAGAAVGGGETTSVVSTAYDDLQRGLNKLLESKAPGIKDTNKSIQFYHLAKDAMQQRVDTVSKQEGRSILGKILSASIPTGAGGMAAIATHNPLFALLGGAAGLGGVAANEISKSPQFRKRAASSALQAGGKGLPEILQRLLLLQGGRLGSGM